MVMKIPSARAEHLERVIDSAAEALEACAYALEQSCGEGLSSVAKIREWAVMIERREVIPDSEAGRAALESK